MAVLCVLSVNNAASLCPICAPAGLGLVQFKCKPAGDWGEGLIVLGLGTKRLGQVHQDAPKGKLWAGTDI